MKVLAGICLCYGILLVGSDAETLISQFAKIGFGLMLVGYSAPRVFRT